MTAEGLVGTGGEEPLVVARFVVERERSVSRVLGGVEEPRKEFSVLEDLLVPLVPLDDVFDCDHWVESADDGFLRLVDLRRRSFRNEGILTTSAEVGQRPSAKDHRRQRR